MLLIALNLNRVSLLCVPGYTTTELRNDMVDELAKQDADMHFSEPEALIGVSKR